MTSRALKIGGAVAAGLAVLAAWMLIPPSGPVPLSGAAPVATGWRAETVLTGLEHPWAVAWLPSGELLLTERPGRLRIVRAGRLDPTPVAGVPPVFARGHAGLMDLSVHPRFAVNRHVYLTYSEGTTEANRTRLARGRLSEDGTRLTEVTVIFSVERTKEREQQFGSRLLWLPDETLLLALGDGGNPPVSLDGRLIREQAQNLRSRFGKMVRLRDDGTPASDNPFAGRPEVDPAIWSYGHRNIQGLARDPVSGRLWATEHGARGGDELNLLTAGGNYGWPLVTYSREYTYLPITGERSRAGMIDPRVVWTPAQAPSGLAFYTGEVFPAWRGDLFSGGLLTDEVRRVDLDDAGNVVAEESLPIGARVRDVRQGPDGHLYVLTDEPQGRLLRLVPMR